MASVRYHVSLYDRAKGHVGTCEGNADTLADAMKECERALIKANDQDGYNIASTTITIQRKF